MVDSGSSLDLSNAPAKPGLNPFPKDILLDCFQIKELADDNFKYDENDGNFFKQLENTVGKGEIARYEQFLLFPQCFQKTCTAYAYT